MKWIAWVLSGVVWALSAIPAWAILGETKSVTLQSSATANGNGTPILANGYDILGLDIEIAGTATVTIQGRSSYAASYRNVPCYSRAASSTTASASSSANFQCAVSGLKDVQAVISSCAGCTVSVTGQLTTASSGATVQAISGNIAHDSADAQSPVVMGGHASASVLGETVVTDQDAVRWHFGRDGVPNVRTGCPLEDIVSAVVTATSGANTSGIAAQGAGIKTYLHQIIVFNNGASNGSMIITDGSGGSTKTKIFFPASTGTTVVFPLPIGFSANTAVFVDPTGTDNIDVTLVGCKSKL